MAGGGRLNEVGPYHCQHHHVDGHDDDDGQQVWCWCWWWW